MQMYRVIMLKLIIARKIMYTQLFIFFRLYWEFGIVCLMKDRKYYLE